MATLSTSASGIMGAANRSKKLCNNRYNRALTETVGNKHTTPALTVDARDVEVALVELAVAALVHGGVVAPATPGINSRRTA